MPRKRPIKGALTLLFLLVGSLTLQAQVLITQQEQCRPGDTIVALVYPLPDRATPLYLTLPDGSTRELPGIPWPIKDLGQGYLCFVPISPDSPPGTASLEWEDQSLTIEVLYREFSTLYIPLSEPPLPEGAGDNRLFRQLARFNPDQIHWRGAPFRKPLNSYIQISSPYGERRTFSRGGRSWNEIHQGIDYAMRRGTPVYAPTDGRAVISEFLNSPGNLVVVEFFPGMYQLFYHLDSRTVERRDVIRKGDLLGTLGTTGKSTGPHLHFEVRVHGVFVDPQPFLDGFYNLDRILPAMVNRRLLSTP